MTVSEAAGLLRGLAPRLLEGLAPSDRALLFETASVRRFGHGSVITRQGFPAVALALVVQGRARFTCMTITGRKLNLRLIYPGEICGLAALMAHPCDYILGAEVIKTSVALVWQRSAIRSFSEGCPRLLDNGLLLAYEYLRLYKIAHVAATSQTARQRLALVLGTIAGGIGREVEEGVEVNVRNEELANEANVTVFTASRFLNEWQREGILVKTRGKILLRSPEDLLRRAS